MNRLILVLCATPVVLLSLSLRTQAQVGLGHHPPIAQQRYLLEVAFSDATGPRVVRAPIELTDSTAPTTLDQTIALPAPLRPIHVREFLPKAKLHQDVKPDDAPGARPATLVSIEGPTQSASRWLLADDPRRNRLTSLIGTWRFMTVDDKDVRDRLFHDFETEYTRPPTLHVASPDGSSGSSFVAEPGTIHELAELSGRFRVREFYPHYAISDTTNKPTNISAQRVNPAILVELEKDGKREERWVFARFPDYTTGAPRQIPWKVTLDCPTEGTAPRPDVAVVFTRPATWEVWIRHAGRTKSHAAAADTSFDLPSTQYRFRLERLIPSGRLVESYRPVSENDGIQAIRVESVNDRGQSVVVWLTPNKPHTLATKGGTITLQLLTGLAQGGGHP